MKKHWMLLAVLFLQSCSDDKELNKEVPGTDEPEIEVVEPEITLCYRTRCNKHESQKSHPNIRMAFLYGN